MTGIGKKIERMSSVIRMPTKSIGVVRDTHSMWNASRRTHDQYLAHSITGYIYICVPTVLLFERRVHQETNNMVMVAVVAAVGYYIHACAKNSLPLSRALASLSPFW